MSCHVIRFLFFSGGSFLRFGKNTIRGSLSVCNSQGVGRLYTTETGGALLGDWNAPWYGMKKFFEVESAVEQ